jgi:RHS repeat-associated protein
VLIATALAIVTITAIPAHAQTTPDQLLFGPKQYLRTGTQPNEYTDTVTVPISVGPPFILSIENGQANGQNRVSAAWIYINDVEILGPNDFSQTPATLERTITLTPTNTLRVKLASVPNSYLTVRIYGTAILPTPVGIAPNPLIVTQGATGTMTVTLSPTPTAAGNLSMSTANTAIATVPVSVGFAVGQTAVAVPVTAVAEGSTQVTATLNGRSVTNTVQVTPRPPTLTTLEPPRQSITQGGSGTITITMSPAQGTDTTVPLNSSVSGIVFVPATVIVPAGQTTVSFSVSGNVSGSTRITASLNGTTVSGLVTVVSASPSVVSLEPPSVPATLGVTVPFTVRLSVAPVINTVITIEATPAGLVTVPASVTVLAGQLTATVPVTTGMSLGTAVVTATLNGSVSASVHITPPPLAVVSLTPSTLSLTADASGQLTVILNAAQPSTTDVVLAVNNPGVLRVPPQVTVPAGQTQAILTVTGLVGGNAVVTATLGSSSTTAAVNVVPPPPAVTGLVPSPLPLQQGATGSLTIMTNAAQPTETVIPLTTSGAIVEVPTSVTVPAGQTSAIVPVISLSLGTVTISATLNGTVTATVQVVAPPITVTSVTPALTLPKGKPGVLRVTVSAAPTEPVVITLNSSTPTVATTPGSVTIAAGALGADVPVFTNGQGSTTVTATLNGTASTTVTVTPPEIVLLTLSPQGPSRFLGESATFTVNGTYTDGTRQDVSTSVTWSSSNESVATISTAGVATTLAAGSTTIKAAVSPAPGAVSATTILTVLPPAPMTIAPATATFRVDEQLTVTVTSSAAAGEGGLTITLTASGTGSVTITPTSVTVPVGNSSAEFTVTATGVGNVTLTASAIGRQSATSTLTILPGVPTISSFSPMTGPVGTAVTISGQSFDPVAANNQVKFNGLSAIITSATATTITTTVPQGATTGPITVTTANGTGTSAQNFTVTPHEAFTLSATPATTTAIQGGQMAYAVSLSGNFTGLAALSVTGLPTGVTGQFSSPTLSGTQTSILTLSVASTVAPALSGFTVTGTGTTDTGTQTQSLSLSLQVVASGGQTAVTGQFLTVAGLPIPNIVVKIGTIQTQTDAAGNFLLQNVPAGTQPLMVDANAAVAGLPIYAFDVALTAGQTNVLPISYLTPPPPPEAFTPINNATADQILTDPRFPGLEVKLPAGVTITGWDGTVKTQVAIQHYSPDRLGVPPPPGPTHSLYQLSFGTPMGGFLSNGAVIPVTFPNDTGLSPGERAEFWYYDASPLGGPASWKLAGMSTVSADGTQLIPDPGVGIPRFCGHCGIGCIIDRLTDKAKRLWAGLSGGEPVDLATGLFTVEKTDLVLPGRFPLTIGRSYFSIDPIGGIASVRFSSLAERWALSLDIAIFPVSPSLHKLILPGDNELNLVARPDGTFVNTTHPFLKGAVLSTITGGDLQLRFKDGTTWRLHLFILGVGGNIPIYYLTEQADRNGNRITIERTGAEISRVIDASGRIVQMTNSSGKLTAIRDPLGRTVSYTYDNNSRLSTVTDPEGGITRYTYDGFINVVAITDARGITFIQNFYGNSGRVLRQVQADGGEWRFRYRLQGATVSGPGCPGLSCPTEESWENVQGGYSVASGTGAGIVTSTTVVDPRGLTTSHRFNNIGFDNEGTDALGQKTVVIRDASNQVAASTDPLGRTTRFEYDTRGNVTKITDPAGTATDFEYETAFNRVTKITQRPDATTTLITEFTYDPANGNLLTVKDPLNHVTSIGYNAFGQPTSVQGPVAAEPPTTFAYDTDGNLITTTDPVGNVTQRVYDAVSRLTSLTDARGLSTQFQYDALNRVITIADAAHGLTRFFYDGNGNLLNVADAKGQLTTYTYDSMDRLATRTDALNRQETYTFDPAGNLIQFKDRKNQPTTFTYDALNRRLSATYADSSSTTLAYDSVGRLARATDSITGTIEFSYDTLDRLAKEVTPQGAVTYQYDPLGRRIQMIANGQEPVTYQYDAASRLKQVAQGIQVVGLSYDDANRRTLLTYPNGTNTTYGYDHASRLTTIVHQGAAGLIESLTYTYDAAGNRISLNRENGTATLLPAAVQAAYDVANEQTKFGNPLPASANLIYDANGNLASQTDATGTTTYTWDKRNRLTAVSGPGLSASFVYDALGRRVSKTINGLTTQFLYDGSDIMQEIGGSAVGVTYLRTLSVDEPFIKQVTTGNEYYHIDAIGSTLALTNDAGTATTNYGYEAFGKTATTGTSTNALRYAGREDDGTGLYYNRARYYSPGSHRFLSEDPIGAGQNLYVYVENQPVLARDPFGLYTVVVRGGVGSGPIGPSGSGESSGPIADALRAAGESVPPVYGTDAAGTALRDLKAHQGDPTGVNVVCHSRGCGKILEELSRNPDVKVDRMVTMDCAFSSGCGTIPNNVQQNLNYWQDSGLLQGSRNRRSNGGGAGITNVQVPHGHSEIPQQDTIRNGIVGCIVKGACGGGGDMGGRK